MPTCPAPRPVVKLRRTFPEVVRLHLNPKDRYSLGHAQAILLKGLEENYAWLGQHWPDSRYLVISLSFDDGRIFSPVRILRPQRQGRQKPSIPTRLTVAKPR